MVILDLWGMVFHAMVVIAPIYILLLESIWACCESVVANDGRVLEVVELPPHFLGLYSVGTYFRCLC